MLRDEKGAVTGYRGSGSVAEVHDWGRSLHPSGPQFPQPKRGIITLGLSSSQPEQGPVLEFYLSPRCDTQHIIGDDEGKAPSMRPGTQQMIAPMNSLEQPPVVQIKALSTALLPHPTTSAPTNFF